MSAKLKLAVLGIPIVCAIACGESFVESRGEEAVVSETDNGEYVFIGSVTRNFYLKSKFTGNDLQVIDEGKKASIGQSCFELWAPSEEIARQIYEEIVTSAISQTSAEKEDFSNLQLAKSCSELEGGFFELASCDNWLDSELSSKYEKHLRSNLKFNGYLATARAVSDYPNLNCTFPELKQDLNSYAIYFGSNAQPAQPNTENCLEVEDSQNSLAVEVASELIIATLPNSMGVYLRKDANKVCSESDSSLAKCRETAIDSNLEDLNLASTRVEAVRLPLNAWFLELGIGESGEWSCSYLNEEQDVVSHYKLSWIDQDDATIGAACITSQAKFGWMDEFASELVGSIYQSYKSGELIPSLTEADSCNEPDFSTQRLCRPSAILSPIEELKLYDSQSAQESAVIILMAFDSAAVDNGILDELLSTYIDGQGNLVTSGEADAQFTVLVDRCDPSE